MSFLYGDGPFEILPLIFNCYEKPQEFGLCEPKKHELVFADKNDPRNRGEVHSQNDWITRKNPIVELQYP